MSDQLNQANIAASGSSAADTSGDETKSRRDFLRARARVSSAPQQQPPMFSASVQAQGDDTGLARVLGQRLILIKGGVVQRSGFMADLLG
jgi:hypothetical protein